MNFGGLDFLYLLLVFSLWLVALIASGRVLLGLISSTSSLKSLERLALSLAIGSLVSVFLYAILGGLGLLGARYFSFYWSLVVLALAAGWHSYRTEWKSLIPEPFFPKDWSIRFLCLGFFLFVGFRLLAASFPSGHGDPLLYHLVGPRVWHELGAIRLAPDLPNALIANSWEYLYGWGVELLGASNPITNLIEAQVFAQWTHLILGGMGSALFLFLLLNRFSSPALAGTAVLTAITLASLQWTLSLAKNDWGVAFWFLAGLYSFDLAIRHRERAWVVVAGLLWGLALVAKLNTALFLVPALLLLTRKMGGRLPRQLLFTLLLPSLLLAATLILARNWWLTGSPVFPMFQNWWPSPWISDSWYAHISGNQPKAKTISFAALLLRVQQLLREGAGGLAILFGFLLLAWAYFRKKNWGQRTLSEEAGLSLLNLWGIGAGAMLIFLLVVGDDQEIRYLGAGLLLLTSTSTLLLGNALRSREKYFHYLLPLWIVLVVALGKVPFHMLTKKHFPKTGEAAIHQMNAGDAKLWLRSNLAPAEKIILIADNETYYLLGLPVTILTERPDLDRATRQETNLDRWLAAIEQVTPEARYILDSRPSLGLAPRFPTETARIDAAVSFQGLSARVVDLKKLAAPIAKAPPER